MARTSPAPVLNRAQARTLWSVLVLVLVLAVIASVALPGVVGLRRSAALSVIFLPVAAALTALDLAMAYVLPGIIRRRAGMAGAPSADAVAGVQTIVACALALGVALFDCLAYLLTGEALLLLLVVPCAAVLLHWFPSESRWRAISPPGAAGARSGGRMIRE